MKLRIIYLLFLLCSTSLLQAENGYELWLRYRPVAKGTSHTSYCMKNQKIMFPGETESLIAARKELQAGLSGLLDIPYTETKVLENNMLVVGTPQSVPLFKQQTFHTEIDGLADEGYLIRSCTIEGKKVTVIAARTDVGVLYGVFHYLRLMQTDHSLDKLHIQENPKLKYRESLGQPERHRRTRLCRLQHLELGTASILQRTTLHRLCTCQCLHRYQRSSAQQCKCPSQKPAVRLVSQSLRIGRRIPSLRHQSVSDGKVQRPQGDRRTEHGEPQRSPSTEVVER